MPDVNLLKNTEQYDPLKPKPVPPVGPGPLSDPELQRPGFGGALRSFFSRRPKAAAPVVTPTLGKAVGSSGRMNLGKTGGGDRVLEEKKSKPTMLQLPDEEDGNFNVNLLGQDAGREVTLRQQLMKLVMVAVGSMALVGAVYGGLAWYSGTISTDIAATTEKITALRGEIAALQTGQTDIAATTKKITAIRGLIDRHVHWSKFFRQLENATGPEIFYGPSFTGDLNGAVTLAARAPSFDAVATQYLFYQQAVQRGGFISDFTITGAAQRDTQTGPEVSFSVDLQLVPEVFYISAEEATAAETPTNTNSPTTP